MKRFRRLLAYILAFLAFEGCSAMHDTVLESKDVQFFKVQELQGTKPTKLKLSGLAFNSAMSVKEITTKTEGSAILVLVHLALAKPGTSGSFEYDLVVPDPIKEVEFGNSKTSIWKKRPS